MVSLGIVWVFPLMFMTCSLLMSAVVVNSTTELDKYTGVIFATSRTYGPKNDTCEYVNGCYSGCHGGLAFVSLCNGLADCVFTNEKLKTEDKCLSSNKYFNITHVCVPPKSIVICEGDQINLECELGIKIIDAKYGRTDETTCSEISSQPLSTDCLVAKAMAIVSESCDDEKHCSIAASNDVFFDYNGGEDEHDPCVGTSKYLNISYFCKPT